MSAEYALTGERPDKSCSVHSCPRLHGPRSLPKSGAACSESRRAVESGVSGDHLAVGLPRQDGRAESEAPEAMLVGFDASDVGGQGPIVLSERRRHAYVG